MRVHLSTNLVPKKPAERREWIKFQLRVRCGLSMRAVARDCGCSVQAISRAAAGFPSEEIERKLSDLLDVPQHVLFPEHYDGAVRIPSARPRRTKPTAAEGGRNDQNRRVA